MIGKIKQWLYFPLASYFRFFAQIRLFLWKPRIFLITGSSGKTTLLHLIEAQLGDQAKYSHRANSSFGIPFDILGLGREKLTLIEWPILFFLAPFKIFLSAPKQKLYIVEADCDRPGEGKFLTRLLKPEVTLWVSLSKTHSMNFDSLLRRQKFPTIESAIAHEFGFFVAAAKKLVIVNADSADITNQLKRAQADVVKVSQSQLSNYSPSLAKTSFTVSKEKFELNYLLPQETFYEIYMCKRLLDYLDKKFNPDFPGFKLPPGRSSVFKGVKNITIVDSTYNSNLGSATAVLNMFKKIPADNKWLVLGDMIEQGEQEAMEHRKLARVIKNGRYQKIIFLGPRVRKYTQPLLKDYPAPVITFLKPDQVLEFIKANLQGGELILFKGARFLEGVIENLLKDKSDNQYLSRREKIWQKRRKKWGM